MALTDIRAGKTPFELTATPHEAGEMAAFLNAQKISKFSFRGAAGFDEAGALHVTGRLGVTVTQSCVVTLGPVRTRIDVDVDRIFAPDLPEPDEDHQLQADEDKIEPLVDPIDLGLIALEDIALAMPAYPRAEDAGLAETVFAAPGVMPLRDEDIKPFASLAALRDKMARDD